MEGSRWEVAPQIGVCSRVAAGYPQKGALVGGATQNCRPLGRERLTETAVSMGQYHISSPGHKQSQGLQLNNKLPLSVMLHRANTLKM